MARGYPDYANPLYSLASRNVDFSILETMSLGIPSLDGKGRIAWWDNFREGVYRWRQVLGGDASLAYAHNLQALIPPVSVRFPAGTLAGAGVTSLWVEGFHDQALSLGLEQSWGWSSGNALLYSILIYDDGDFLHQALVRIATSTGVVSIQASTGFVDITTILNTGYSATFNRIKVVANYSLDRFERLLVGQEEFDLTAYSLVSVATVTEGIYAVIERATANAAALPEINLGHVIFTIDEP